MRIRLLGPLVVGDPDGATVNLAGTRVRVLLTALALEAGHPVSSARLIDTLWPQEQPVNPANALQALASRLRGTLGRELVAATATGYRLALDPEQIDVHRFEALLRQPGPAVERLTLALSLWRGPALADVPGFADAAARLEARRETAHEDLLEARLDAGDAEELLAELHALTAGAPLRDRPRALLIRALHRAGRCSRRNWARTPPRCCARPIRPRSAPRRTPTRCRRPRPNRAPCPRHSPASSAGRTNWPLSRPSWTPPGWSP